MKINISFFLFLGILDIPVYKTSHNNDKVQALHVLFTLYNEFQNSQVKIFQCFFFNLLVYMGDGKKTQMRSLNSVKIIKFSYKKQI